MRELQDKEVFSLFRSRLNDTRDLDISFEDNWEEMEQLLNGKSKKRFAMVRLYQAASGIAALLLLFVGWQLLIKNVPEKKQVTGALTKYQEKRQSSSKAIIEGRPHKANWDKEVLYSKATSTASHKNLLKGKTNKDISGTDPTLTELGDSLLKKDNIIAVINTHTNLDSSSKGITLALSQDSVTGNQSVLKNKKHSGSFTSHGPRITLAILAAPDLNGMNSFKGQTGFNFNLQFTYSITDRLSISSGAAYASKPYQTSFSDYRGGKTAWWAKTFSTTGLPNEVSANCKVLDIPLNINFQVIDKGNNRFSVGSGISSYFMLSENYRFAFADQNTPDANLTIKNQNQHLFGVLNLNTTYQRQVSHNFGLIVQPYLKLPLTQIGFGQVDLKSAGIAVGFSWNINLLNRNK